MIDDVEKKIRAGIRLDRDDATALYETDDILRLGRLADMVRRKRHGKKAFYVRNMHLNYTNVCVNRCLFCAYAKDRGEAGAFTYSEEEVLAHLARDADASVRELHVVGGLNPELGPDYYSGLLKTLKSARPDATIKAFTAVEIDWLADVSGLSVERVLEGLKGAGLGMMPGGGAEVLSERVRSRLFPKKISGKRWLEITKKAHEAGITTNATMLYGHIETVEERVEHLLALRSLQDETGGFSAFIPLAFHSANTRLSRIPETTGFDDLKAVAAARLVLDNFEHIKAYWVMLGEKVAQLALSFGADDLDGTIMEEKITHMAGAKTAKGLTRDEMENLISKAGFVPVERDSFYNPV